MIQKILLINCTVENTTRNKLKEAVSSPNLGLMSIASVLSMHGYEVKIVDFFVETLTKPYLKEIYEGFAPDLIGFSVYTRHTRFLKQVSNAFRQMGFCGPFVAGGPHPSAMPEELITVYHMDYVIHGEGEFTFVKLIESLNSGGVYPLSAINGLSYPLEETIIHAPKKGFIEVLDALPLQNTHLFNPSLYSLPFTLITSRGCPGDCIYCASRALAGKKYRMRSAENILCEILYLKQALNSTKFTILDDTFTADANRFNRFAALLKGTDIVFNYRIESRGDVLTEDILNQLKATHCKVIHVGVESGSQSTLDKIGKNIDLKETVDRICYGQTIGIQMVASFIIGNHCDDELAIQETLSLMKTLGATGVNTSTAVCTPFPGTPLFKHRDKLGLTIHATSWEEYDFGNVIISTPTLSQDRLRQLLFESSQITNAS